MTTKRKSLALFLLTAVLALMVNLASNCFAMMPSHACCGPSTASSSFIQKAASKPINAPQMACCQSSNLGLAQASQTSLTDTDLAKPASGFQTSLPLLLSSNAIDIVSHSRLNHEFIRDESRRRTLELSVFLN